MSHNKKTEINSNKNHNQTLSIHHLKPLLVNFLRIDRTLYSYLTKSIS